MRHFLKALMIAPALTVAAPILAANGPMPSATLFKNPQCGCCEQYAEYLRSNGYEVKVIPTHDLSLIKQRQSIPSELQGCHTTLIGGYAVEGHVPVASMERLLANRPDINGITLPGMPAGSPGMSGLKAEPFTVYALAKNGRSSVYSVE